MISRIKNHPLWLHRKKSVLLVLLFLGSAGAGVIIVKVAKGPREKPQGSTLIQPRYGATTSGSAFSKRQGASGDDEANLPPELAARLGKKVSPISYGDSARAAQALMQNRSGAKAGVDKSGALAGAAGGGSDKSDGGAVYNYYASDPTEYVAYADAAGGGAQDSGVSFQALQQRGLAGEGNKSPMSRSGTSAAPSSASPPAGPAAGGRAAHAQGEAARSANFSRTQSLKSGQAVSRQGGVNAVRGAVGGEAFAGRMGRAGRAGVSQGPSYNAELKGEFAKDELIQRAEIAAQAEGQVSPDSSAGAIKTALGETGASGTVEAAGSGADSAPIQFDGNITGPIALPSGNDSDYNVDASLAHGWRFSWSPVLIKGPEGGKEKKKWAGDELVKRWNSWTQLQNANLGALAAVGRDTTRLQSTWKQSGQSTIDQLVGTIFGDKCVSFYSDVKITLHHDQYGAHTINCSQPNGTPPPLFALASCTGQPFTLKPNAGFESAVFGFFKNKWPSVTSNVGASPPPTGVIPPEHVNDVPPSTYYDGPGGQWVPTGPDLCAGTLGSQDKIGCIQEYLGYGLFKLSYGLCVKCDEALHTSLWPSVYFSLYRDFNFEAGSQDNDPYNDRCLPANSPLVGSYVDCTLAANKKFAELCTSDKTGKLIEDNVAGFKDALNNPNNKNKTIYQICDEFYQLQSAVDKCIASAANAPNSKPDTTPIESLQSKI